MRALIAPDKFKGSLRAAEVADQLAMGLAESGVESITLPLADGGDGSVAAAVAAGFTPQSCTVADALGRPHPATIAIKDATAVVEVANTCGLATLPQGVLAPMNASTLGFGQAIRHALRLGARSLVLGLGGSASTDGGIGMLAALGYGFSDAAGDAVAPSARNLNHINRIHTCDAVSLKDLDVVLASDVTHPLTGPSGAAAVFGPQKGASIADIDCLETGLDALVEAAERSGWNDARALAATPGAGAAGGCGFAALLLGATMVSGADYFLDLLGFDEYRRDADLVITGEGRLDVQSLGGKLPVAVARRAAPTPVVAVVGRNDLGSQTGPFSEIYALADLSDVDTSQDAEAAATLVQSIGATIGRRLSP
ncbi:MAG: glycerate kinase [Mycobacterium sp.]